MTVIADSGPLMALGKLGQLSLLFRLYGRIEIPETVHQEVVVEGNRRGFPDALRVETALRRGQLVITRINPSEFPPDIASLPLDTGEKEAIYLAARTPDSLVLLDDLKAREEARTRGLRVKGTLGILVGACRGALISLDDAEAIIGAIMANDSIWIADGLCRRIIEALRSEAGEYPRQ